MIRLMMYTRTCMYKDITGKKFGRLLVLKKVNKTDKQYHLFWLCKCDCGKSKVIRGDSLKNGAIRSCGCFHNEIAVINQRKSHLTHGKTGTKVYITWKQIQVRCNKKTDKNYKRYGGRGIKCKWKSFEEFYRDMGDPPNKFSSIDRIDNNGNYCKENCRWATKKEQANNRRSCKLFTFNNKTQNLKQWSEEYKINYKVLWYRIKVGWKFEEAICKNKY